jgi:hypothetical protein
VWSGLWPSWTRSPRRLRLETETKDRSRAIVVWDPIGSLVRAVDLPEWVSLPDLPDVPRWLLWALGKVKFAVIAVVVLVVALRALRRGRGA